MAASTTLSLSFPEPDIAVLTLDDPASSANVLSRHVLEALEAHLNELDKRPKLAGLVIRSAKPGMFVAGADLREFAQSLDAPKEEITSYCRLGQQLFGRLAKSSYVTVAAIDGLCIGGGAELAIWCDRRVLTASDKTAFGFPEVKLGLFPGWGGTARAPRILGLSNAIELITGGENIDARAAAQMGLAHDVVATTDTTSEALLSAAVRPIRAEQASQDFRRDRERWAAPIVMSDTELGFLAATASAYIQDITKGHYPAPLAALELMIGAAGVDVETACQMEAEEFAKLFGSPINRALLNIFFLREHNKKDTGIAANNATATESTGATGSASASAVKSQTITSAGVVGAGVMGQGITAANVKRGIPVALMDSTPEALARGVQGVLTEVSYNKQLKGPDAKRAVELAPLVNGTLSDVELCRADIVIEAIFEDLAAKRQLFARLDPLMRENAILCSNTSTIPITKLAEGLERPEQFCGLHFFNPVRQMPLVEVIRGKKTSDATIARAVAYAKSLGKSPIAMNDGPGFLVNRLLLPYMNEAALLLCEGASIGSVERAAKSFGMPMGPITLFDVVGIDVAVHAGKTMLAAFPDRVVPAEILQKLFERGRLGQKTGRGFFDYGPTKPGKPPKGIESAEVNELINECRKGAGRKFSSEELTDRLFLPMLLEATRALEDKIVRNVRDVDLALILGIGFPPFRGGLFFWADTLARAQIVEKLKQYSPLGKRYEPTAMLTKLTQSGAKFYD